MNGWSPRRLKVGVLLSVSEREGGSFVQSLNIARLFAPSDADGYDVEYVAVDKGDRERLVQAGFSVAASSDTSARFLVDLLDHMPSAKALLRRIYGVLFKRDNSLDKFAARHGFDVLVFTSSSRQAMSVQRTPFIYTVWDVCHRDHPEFPEFTSDGSFAWREQLFSSVLPRASAYIADTKQFADRLAVTYGADRSKAIIVPYRVADEVLQAPAGSAEIENLRRKYALDRPFVFYPAQFWAHKNHVYILRALAILRERAVDVGAVFSGSDRGTSLRVRRMADRLGLNDRVKFLGFVSTQEIAQLYRGAVALVMPSYFGPTNIPPLEAEALGCHMIYADLPGYREFAGPDCMYCDLTRPENLADLIVEVMARPKRAPDMRDPKIAEAKRKINRMLAGLAAKTLTWSD